MILPFAEQQRLEELEKENKIRQSRVLCPERIPETTQSDEKTEKEQNEVPLRDLKNKRKLPENDLESPPKKFKSKIESEEKSNSDSDSSVDTPIVESTPIKPKKELKNETKTEIIDDSDTDSVVEVSNLSAPIEINSDSEDETSKPNHKSPKSGRNKKNKKNKFKNKFTKNQTTQQSSKSVPFDYTKVDFKRFQGGSQHNTSGDQANSKFHAKVNFIIDFYIYFTISNFNYYFRGKIRRTLRNLIKCFLLVT